jgi:protein SCO1/2
MRSLALILTVGLALAHSGHYLPASGPGAVDMRPARSLPPVELVGEDSRAVVFPAKGTVWAVYFGYTGCPDACPLTLSRLAPLMESEFSSIRLGFISVDPQDTPAILSRYLSGFRPARGYSANPQSLRALADAIGLEYNRAPGGRLIFHTDAIALLNSQGKVVRVLFGASRLSQNELRMELRRLL